MGIYIAGTAQVTFSECMMIENHIGISLKDSAQAELAHCTISDNQDSGVKLSGSSQVVIIDSEILRNHGDGLHLADSSSVELRDSMISNNVFSGLYVRDESDADVTSCDILQSLHGVELVGSSQLTMAKTSIHENRYNAIDLSDSAGALVTDSHLCHNRLGVRVRGRAQAELVSSIIDENSSGMLLLDSTQTQITDCLLAGNTWDAVSLWDDAGISIERSSCTNNGRYNVAVGGEPYSPQPTEEITAEIAAQGACLSYPKEPPEAMRKAVESVVEIWTDGRDEVTGEYWPFSAQGVILTSGEILTVAHVFYGEDMHNPDVWLDLDAVQVRDPDSEVTLFEMKDLIKGQTSHGLHPAAMDHSRDLAALYPRQKLREGLPVAEGFAPCEVVWVVAQIYETSTWAFIPGRVYIPPRWMIEAWYELFMEGEQPFFLTDLRIKLAREADPGFSGSPVVNARGEVIGILVRRTSFQGHCNIGVSLATLVPQLKLNAEVGTYQLIPRH